MIMAVLDIRLGDVFRLRKPHPCGGFDWRVQRTGADIRMVCLGCGHEMTRQAMQRALLALNPNWNARPVAVAPDGDAQRPLRPSTVVAWTRGSAPPPLDSSVEVMLSPICNYLKR